MSEAENTPTPFSTSLSLLDDRFAGLSAILDHATAAEWRARYDAWFDEAPQKTEYLIDICEITYLLAELIGNLPARSAIGLQTKARAILWLMSRDDNDPADADEARPEARVLAGLIRDIGAL